MRRSYSGLLKGQQKPTVNMVPFVIGIVILGIFGFVLLQQSWIMKLATRGPVQEDPMDKISWIEARQRLYNTIETNLKAVGAKGQYTWAKTNGTSDPVDINSQGPVELTVNTSLTDPNQRRQIIDPAKDYMHKAQVPSLVMNDAKSHATWTYTVQLPSPQSSPEEQQPAQPLQPRQQQMLQQQQQQMLRQQQQQMLQQQQQQVQQQQQQQPSQQELQQQRFRQEMEQYRNQ